MSLPFVVINIYLLLAEHFSHPSEIKGGRVSRGSSGSAVIADGTTRESTFLQEFARKNNTSALTPPPSPPFTEVAGTHVGLSIDPTLPPIPSTSTLTSEKLPSPSLTPPLSIRNRRSPSSSSRASIRSVSASSFSTGSRNFQPGTMKSAAPVLSAAGEDSFTKYSNEDWSAASSAIPRARTFSASTGRESTEPVILEAPTRSKGPAVLKKERSAGTWKGKEKEAATGRIVSAGDRLKGLLDSSNRK